MNGSFPEIAATPVAPSSGTWSGGRSGTKSGLSKPVHAPSSASHQTSLLRSDHGVPSGLAEARL
jgi:hypothetical protein